MRRRRTQRALAAALFALASAAAAEEFSFDASRYAAKPLESGGYAELRADRFRLDPDTAFHKLNFSGRTVPRDLDRGTATLKPWLRWRPGGDLTANVRAHLDTVHDELAQSRTNRLDEARLAWQASPGLTLEAGKAALKWGKGYAWNPVGFVERLKDPNDPELAREGFTMFTADWIRQFDGALQTVAFTPVLVPTTSGLNADFGPPGHLNAAGKLYLLYNDTDIDFIYQAAGSRPARFGADFSRNLGSNLEVHGEWARTARAQRPLTDALGRSTLDQQAATSWLAGLRYLTERDTTWIAELYRNGSGYTAGQMDEFYRLVEAGAAQFQALGASPLLNRAQALAQGGYGRASAARDYLYLRVSQKEPFDILYFTPALTVIANTADRSASWVPELLYTGVTNVELRLRAFWLAGGAHTEFGEKQNSRRIELLARLYF